MSSRFSLIRLATPRKRAKRQACVQPFLSQDTDLHEPLLSTAFSFIAIDLASFCKMWSWIVYSCAAVDATGLYTQHLIFGTNFSASSYTIGHTVMLLCSPVACIARQAAETLALTVVTTTEPSQPGETLCLSVCCVYLLLF